MKTIFALFGILFLIVIIAVYFKFSSVKNVNFFSLSGIGIKKNPTLTVNNHTVTLLLAQTPKEQQMGLSGKQSLQQNEGMLFLFNRSDYYAFWMNHMQFPIDMIFIQGKKIVTIFANVPYPTFPTNNLPIFKPEEPSDKVLEVNAGFSKKNNVKKGDEVKIDL